MNNSPFSISLLITKSRISLGDKFINLLPNPNMINNSIPFVDKNYFWKFNLKDIKEKLKINWNTSH